MYAGIIEHYVRVWGRDNRQTDTWQGEGRFPGRWWTVRNMLSKRQQEKNTTETGTNRKGKQTSAIMKNSTKRNAKTASHFRTLPQHSGQDKSERSQSGNVAMWRAWSLAAMTAKDCMVHAELLHVLLHALLHCCTLAPPDAGPASTQNRPERIKSPPIQPQSHAKPAKDAGRTGGGQLGWSMLGRGAASRLEASARRKKVEIGGSTTSRWTAKT